MVNEPFIIDGVAARPLPSRHAVTRAQVTHYVAAKVPLAWLRAAHTAHGGIVAWAVWYFRGRARRKPFIASLAELSMGCVSPDTARRALAALEAAGLVAVRRQSGCKAIISIIGPGITTHEDIAHDEGN